MPANWFSQLRTKFERNSMLVVEETNTDQGAGGRSSVAARPTTAKRTGHFSSLLAEESAQVESAPPQHPAPLERTSKAAAPRHVEAAPASRVRGLRAIFERGRGAMLCEDDE